MDFRRKGAIIRHRGFRAHGRQRRCNNITQITTAPPLAAPQGPPAPGVVVVFVFSHRFGRPCARNPLRRVTAPPYVAR
eukprot:10685779-Heterocapsa_arctica.AAC.1